MQANILEMLEGKLLLSEVCARILMVCNKNESVHRRINLEMRFESLRHLLLV